MWWQMLDCNDEQMIKWLKYKTTVDEQYVIQCVAGLSAKAGKYLAA